MAVHALAKTEEGERRAYKIDFSAVEITDLIGSGMFQLEQRISQTKLRQHLHHGGMNGVTTKLTRKVHILL